jgi:hypothetical protein
MGYILYVSKSRLNWGETNRKVEKLNGLLKKYNREKNLMYLDINKELTSNGSLIDKYTNDGVHLKEEPLLGRILIP